MGQQVRVLPINSCQSESGDHRPASCRGQVIGGVILAQSNVGAPFAHLQSDWAVAEGTDPLAQGASDASWIEGLWNTAVLENRDDCVIRSLSSALQAAERRHGKYCADALRLAIVVTLLGLRWEMRNAATSDKIGFTQRQIRALQKWRLKRVVDYVENHLSAKIALSDLAAVAGLSRMHFASQFRTATGLRPHEFLLRRRIQRAEELLRNTTMPIVEIALTVGFRTQAHLTTVFKRFAGCTPGRRRAINQMPVAPQPGRSNRTEIVNAVVD
ncbi:AraC-type DNA-binding protein [Rhizobiales bacterium GAS191]|nr:AraC-type DNA-binding protein [Rhizobiales bacterium GAS191]